MWVVHDYNDSIAYGPWETKEQLEEEFRAFRLADGWSEADLEYIFEDAAILEVVPANIEKQLEKQQNDLQRQIDELEERKANIANPSPASQF